MPVQRTGLLRSTFENNFPNNEHLDISYDGDGNPSIVSTGDPPYKATTLQGKLSSHENRILSPYLPTRYNTNWLGYLRLGSSPTRSAPSDGEISFSDHEANGSQYGLIRQPKGFFWFNNYGGLDDPMSPLATIWTDVLRPRMIFSWSSDFRLPIEPAPLGVIGYIGDFTGPDPAPIYRTFATPDQVSGGRLLAMMIDPYIGYLLTTGGSHVLPPNLYGLDYSTIVGTIANYQNCYEKFQYTFIEVERNSFDPDTSDPLVEQDDIAFSDSMFAIFDSAGLNYRKVTVSEDVGGLEDAAVQAILLPYIQDEIELFFDS